MIRQTHKHCEINNLKRRFTNDEKISYNYSQADQGIFVLSMLDGLEYGTYLEIGAAWPDHISNTALLESDQTVIFCVCGMVHDGLLAF